MLETKGPIGWGKTGSASEQAPEFLHRSGAVGDCDRPALLQIIHVDPVLRKISIAARGICDIVIGGDGIFPLHLSRPRMRNDDPSAGANTISRAGLR